VPDKRRHDTLDQLLKRHLLAGSASNAVDHPRIEPAPARGCQHFDQQCVASFHVDAANQLDPGRVAGCGTDHLDVHAERSRKGAERLRSGSRGQQWHLETAEGDRPQNRHIRVQGSRPIQHRGDLLLVLGDPGEGSTYTVPGCI
jgi:hypothetical protein